MRLLETKIPHCNEYYEQTRMHCHYCSSTKRCNKAYRVYLDSQKEMDAFTYILFCV